MELNAASAPAPAQDVIVEVVRLDGSLAVAATPAIDFVGGVSGNTYTIPANFKSVAFKWLQSTDQGSTVDIQDVIYTAGTGVGTAGYTGMLPQLTNDGGIENHPFSLDVTANAGSFVEIIVTR